MNNTSNLHDSPGMPRKFRLSQRKKHYSSSSSLTVSIPLSAISLPSGHRDEVCTSLPMSLPLSVYVCGDVQSLEYLADRIMHARLLPSGM